MRSADQALDMVESRVDRNEDAKAAIQFARNRRQMRAASATRLVAKQSNTSAETFAEIVDEVSGKLQIDVAQAARSDLRGARRPLTCSPA